MSVNSSSSSNDSLLHPDISFINYDLPLYLYCLTTTPSSLIYTTLMVAFFFLLLPLCIFVIYHGLHQWRQKHSSSSAETASHSDCFTYHMVTMELIGLVGGIITICSIYTKNLNLLFVGMSCGSLNWYGEIFFHTLTCVERYLAVVHPITYVSLRKERGIRMRNITIGCVWLLCIVRTSLLLVDVLVIVDFCFLMFFLTVVSFCSLSVLRVLIRPGPGDQGGGRERVDQSKQRAFYTIMVILGVLVLRFTWNMVWAVLLVSGLRHLCVIMASGIWFNLPSSLVLPLLFLLKARR